MTTSKDKTIEVLGQERRRRWSVEEKLAMVRESLEPGQSVSVVARRNGINPNQLFHWRKLYQDGSLSAVSAGEAVVPASQLADALKQIRELQRMLGKKTMEAEILKEAVEIARSRKWIAHSCCRGTTSESGQWESRCGALAIDGSTQTACSGAATASSQDAQRCGPGRADQAGRRHVAQLRLSPGLGPVASAA